MTKSTGIAWLIDFKISRSLYIASLLKKNKKDKQIHCTRQSEVGGNQSQTNKEYNRRPVQHSCQVGWTVEVERFLCQWVASFHDSCMNGSCFVFFKLCIKLHWQCTIMCIKYGWMADFGCFEESVFVFTGTFTFVTVRVSARSTQ